MKRGKAKASIDTLLAQLFLFGPQAGIIHHRVEMGERGMVREFLEFQADGDW